MIDRPIQLQRPRGDSAPCFNLPIMQLYSVFLVLLCYLYGAIDASSSSLDDMSALASASDPLNPLVVLPMTTSPAALCGNRIFKYFAVELTFEVAVIIGIFVTLVTHVACSIPQLFFTGLLLTAYLHVLEIGLMLVRTKFITESTSAAASPVHLTSNKLVVLLSASGAINLSRAVALLYIAMQGPRYCDTGAYSVTDSIPLGLMAIMLMGGAQLGLLVQHMRLWMHDIDEPLSAGSLQA